MALDVPAGRAVRASPRAGPARRRGRVQDPVTGRELDPADSPRLVIDSAWVFHLEEIAVGRTRLLARTRIRVEPAWALPVLKWMGAGDTVMQRRLLDEIKNRAEQPA